MAQTWFEVVDLEPGVRAIGESLHDENVACFLIEGAERAVLVDAGTGIGDLRALVDLLTALPVTLLVSHGHWDHIGSAAQFADGEILVHRLEADRLREGVDNERMRRFIAPEFMLGPAPEGVDLERLTIPGVEPTGFVADGDVIDLGGRMLEIIEAPGHSPGLLALLDRRSGALFTTDAIYGGSLYAHLAGVDFPAYVESAARLGALQAVTRNVYPSHNARRLEPEILGCVDRAFREVAHGRVADVVEGNVARHRFDGFSILRPTGTGGTQ